jgi:hypothetical protein
MPQEKEFKQVAVEEKIDMLFGNADDEDDRQPGMGSEGGAASRGSGGSARGHMGDGTCASARAFEQQGTGGGALITGQPFSVPVCPCRQ